MREMKEEGYQEDSDVMRSDANAAGSKEPGLEAQEKEEQKEQLEEEEEHVVEETRSRAGLEDGGVSFSRGFVDALDIVHQLRRVIDDDARRSAAANDSPTMGAGCDSRALVDNNSNENSSSSTTNTSHSCTSADDESGAEDGQSVSGPTVENRGVNRTDCDEESYHAVDDDDDDGDDDDDDELVQIFLSAVTLTLQGAHGALAEPRLPADPVAEHLHQVAAREERELQRWAAEVSAPLPLNVFRPIAAAVDGADDGGAQPAVVLAQRSASPLQH